MIKTTKKTTKITVLRLGHRKKRDVRVTTHCALVSRALGADEIVLSGEYDETPLETVLGVTKNWGGKFKACYCADWKKFLKKFKGVKLHLSMYGELLPKKIIEIRRVTKNKNVLVVIGAEKVPSEVYALSDYNVAVGSQPHSEIAALALFLHEFLEGRELETKFAGARIKITPNARGKTVSKTKTRFAKKKTGKK